MPSSSIMPSAMPSIMPSSSVMPSLSVMPSAMPSVIPSSSIMPSAMPSTKPSSSAAPSAMPSAMPSSSMMPSAMPSVMPSSSVMPSAMPDKDIVVVRGDPPVLTVVILLGEVFLMIGEEPVQLDALQLDVRVVLLEVEVQGAAEPDVWTLDGVHVF